MSDLADFAGRRLTVVEGILDELLDHFLEARETHRSGSSGGPNGGLESRLLSMPEVWNDCFRELERALIELRSKPWKGAGGVSWGMLYWQLSEWYLRADRRTVDVVKRVPSRKGWTVVRDGRKHVVDRSQADPELVLLGLRVVRRLFRGTPLPPRHVGRNGGCGKPLFGPAACTCGLTGAEKVAA